MRSIAVLAASVLLVSACNAPRPWGPGVTHYTTLSAGYRAIDHPLADGHAAYALEIASANKAGWGYELVGTYSAENVGGLRDHDLELADVGLGLRRTWAGEGRMVYLVGAGGVFTRVENELHDPRAEFDDEGGAGYAHAAALWNLGLHLERGTDSLLGLDLRGLVGDDYDYLQLAIVFGMGR